MAHFNHDGHRFDLSRTYADVTGVEWTWTGAWTTDLMPEPLMQSGHRGRPDTHDTAIPLPDLYRDRGPLILVTAKIPGELRRAALIGFVADSGPASYRLPGRATR